MASLLYQFHVHVLAAPPGGSFATTWEETASRLESLRQLHFEPDGCFVYSGRDDRQQRWQVDGHLFDFDGHLHRVELHGTCPAREFDRLLECLGWPAQPLVFEMVREGELLAEGQFRARMEAAERPPGA